MRVGASGKPKDPFSAALDALRNQLRSGSLVSGEPLTITDLADDLGLSATPVREALSRLAGERLIEDRRGRGYFAPRLDVSDLVELYGLRRLYLVEALAASAAAAPFPEGEVDGSSAPPAMQLTQVLDRVVARAGNRALFDAYRQVGERLAPCVRVEPQVFAVSDEIDDLRNASAHSDRMADVLDHLHSKRRRQASDLLRVLRAGVNIASL